jgi:DNA-binding CsgD family transcriptional regulator
MTLSPAHSLSDNGFDRIVSTLYDAATGGCEWSAALEPIQQVFDARASVLHTLDIVDGRMLSLHVGGPSLDRAVYDYATNWERQDPRKQRLLKLGMSALGQWLHCHEAFDESYVQRDSFCQHYLAAHEMRFNSNVSFALDERTVTGFILELHASRGPLDPDERELARRLGQHVQQALVSQDRMRRLAASTMVGHQLMEAFAYPMWLLDAERGIHFANAAAQAVEQAERPLRREQGRLRLADIGDDRRLTVQMLQLMQAPHHTRQPLRLGRPGELNEHASWLHLSVLDAQQVMGQAFGPLRYVLATLFRPSHVSALDPFALAQMFDLTPAQARVAALLGEGVQPADIAERLHVGVSTVRSHVREVLAALGQHRMADVVRVLRQGEALWAAPRGTPPPAGPGVP